MSNIAVVRKDQIVEPDPFMAAVQEELDAAKAAHNPDSPWGGSGTVEFYQERVLECDVLEAVKLQVLDEQKEAVKRHYRNVRARLDHLCLPDAERDVKAALRAQGGRKRSVAFLWGTAGYRKTGGKPTVLVTDEPAAIRAAKTAAIPDVVTVTERLNKPALLKHLQASGGDLPGAQLSTTLESDLFYVRSKDTGRRHTVGGDELPAPAPPPLLGNKPTAVQFFDADPDVNDAGL